MHILGVEYEHSGEISCTIIPLLERSFANLSVLPLFDLNDILSTDEFDESPRLLRGPSDGIALAGSTVMLEAFYIGHPEPEVKWLRAGRSIGSYLNARVIKTHGYSKLIIRNITTDQSGKYTIEVSNTHGTDIMATSLGVESQPEPPSGKPCVCIGPDRISVAWCGSPYDGGCMVSRYM